MAKRAPQIIRPLTVEKAREYFSYNPVTGEIHWEVDRHRWPIGTRAGSLDTKGHRRIGCEGRTYASTYIIWLIVYGRPPQGQIDHKNVVSDDDRLANLREATGSQNCMNRRSSGTHPKGVSYHKGTGRYHARITVKSKTQFIGSFGSAVEAGEAYAIKAQFLHGEFAYSSGAQK